MTYKALRQHDCRINERNAFCERGFDYEYSEYERLRQDFLNNKQIADYRTNQQQIQITARENQQ